MKLEMLDVEINLLTEYEKESYTFLPKLTLWAWASIDYKDSRMYIAFDLINLEPKIKNGEIPTKYHNELGYKTIYENSIDVNFYIDIIELHKEKLMVRT